MTAVAAMARGGSGLAYPERFYAASTYAGFGGSPNSADKGVASKFSNDTALLLYALYQQVLAYPFFFLCHTLYRPSFAWAGSCLVKSFNLVDPYVFNIINMRFLLFCWPIFPKSYNFLLDFVSLDVQVDPADFLNCS